MLDQSSLYHVLNLQGSMGKQAQRDIYQRAKSYYHGSASLSFGVSVVFVFGFGVLVLGFSFSRVWGLWVGV